MTQSDPTALLGQLHTARALGAAASRQRELAQQLADAIEPAGEVPAAERENPDAMLEDMIIALNEGRDTQTAGLARAFAKQVDRDRKTPGPVLES